MSLRASMNAALGEAIGSILKIFTTSVEPDYTTPWSVYMEEECTGSGFVIRLESGELVIVTNAHVVAQHVDVRVRKSGGTRKVKARCLVVAHTADLALLTVDDARFWDGVVPLVFGSLPRLYDNVKVVGYPMGGDNACVTSGVVSRVDTTPYARGAERLLVVQIDAAINSGNSGGPALDDASRVVGVAFSGYAGSADNIGYVIPAEVVGRLLLDYAELMLRAPRTREPVKWPGLCDLGVSLQPLENPTHRAALRVDDDAGGVLVTRVAPAGCAKAAGLRAGDVLVAIGGISVANDGSVALRGGERVNCEHLWTSRRSGDEVNIGVLRGGVARDVDVVLAPLRRLVPIADGHDAKPSYVVCGGLVFMALSLPLILAVSTDDSDDEEDCGLETSDALRHADCLGKDATRELEEVVVWVQTLTHDVNFGYAHLCRNFPRLRTVNGTSIASLQHLVDVARGGPPPASGFLDFVLAPPNGHESIHVVLDAALARKTEPALLRRSKAGQD
ncbi:serine-type endopeptidase [Aureococcus anophagefferens]|nr:serine-type endopeptidase [Aureococcus anophagefferens]